jgi:hypothetical protein
MITRPKHRNVDWEESCVCSAPRLIIDNKEFDVQFFLQIFPLF